MSANQRRRGRGLRTRPRRGTRRRTTTMAPVAGDVPSVARRSGGAPDPPAAAPSGSPSSCTARSAASTRARSRARRPTRGWWRSRTRSLVRHVVQPNVGDAVDVFGHSWSPKKRKLIDALYEPRRSKHQPAHDSPSADGRLRSAVLLPARARTSRASGVRWRSSATRAARDGRRVRGGIALVCAGTWSGRRSCASRRCAGWQARAPTAAWLPHHCSDRGRAITGARGSMRQHVCGGKHSAASACR